MADFFWQGGERVEVEHAADSVTIETDSVTAAATAAEGAGVRLQDVTQVAPNLIRANIHQDRDGGMAQLRKDNVVHHVYRAADETGSEYFITETFFVKFKPDTPRRCIEDFVRNERLEVEDMGDDVLLCRVTDATGRNCLKTANSAASRADVEYAEPNLVRFLVRFLETFAFIPGDTLFPRQWHLYAPADGTELKAGAGVFAAEAWELSRGRRDVVISVADDGFDLSHPDFQGEGKIVNQLNVTAGGRASLSYDSNVTPRPGDYHGTPCAGVALAEQNGVGTVGVSPGCGFLPVRFPLNLTDAQLAMMFKRISREADVVSCSWGYPPGYYPMSTTLRDAVAQLARNGGRRGKGLVICVAAGNNNAPVKDLNNTKTYKFWDGQSWQRHSSKIDRWLAAHPDVITVSGCTSLKKRSCYSSWGEQINVCAPTDNWDDQQRFTTEGLGITTTDNEGFGQGSDFTPGSRYTHRFGGTSSATPTVAGLCGLVLSRNPSLSAFEVRDILQDTADKDLLIMSETPVNVPGDFVDGFSLWYGYGKVNALRAVQAAVASDIVRVEASSQAELAIPDNGVRVEDSIEIAKEGRIMDIRLQVDVEHTYIGDLEIDVVAPDGTAVSLHNHEGGATNNLQMTYSTDNRPGLVAFQRRSIQGTWTCHVTDTWSLDRGTLKSWRIVAKVKVANLGPEPAASEGKGARRK